MAKQEAAQKWATVRIPRASKSTLEELSQGWGFSQGHVISVLVERARRQMILEAANLAYAKMREDPELSKKFDEEVAVWDITLGDGLEGM